MTEQRFVIVGASLAGARAAETLREEGFDGRVEVIGAEAELPYERPPLSKGVLLGKDDVQVARLHDEQWYDERQIELRLGSTVDRLDPDAHTVTTEDGEQIGYDKLLLATGSRVRRLDVPGGELDGIRYLRTVGESVALRQALEARPRVVVVGAGWIGLEAAAAAREHGAEVTLVEPQQTALAGVLGPEVGELFAELHRRHDVDLRFGTGVSAFAGSGRVEGVQTDQGDRIPADLVVVGIGVRPNVELASAAGLEVADEADGGGIVADSSLRTSVPDVFAAGDVVRWDHPLLGYPVRVEHWDNARASGPVAAKAMLGQDAVYDAVPFFYTDQYDLGMEYAGHVPAGASYDVVLRGDPASGAYMAFWLGAGDRLLAGMHVNTWGTIDTVQDLIRRQARPGRGRLSDPGVSLGDVGDAG
jgi:3-phenylpropionate/trans-cinnamate dioxygenase ferredoxin reductase component